MSQFDEKSKLQEKRLGNMESRASDDTTAASTPRERGRIGTMVEHLFPPTLVKYDNPVMVVKQTHKPHQIISFSGGSASGPESAEAQPCQDAGLTKKETEEIFNAILPPREWSHEGNLWRQTVSSTPATRADVIALEETLNTRLKQRQARQTGLCPIRRELYSQCFDEIIRQVTINCAERGLLLLRVRDETNTTMEAYRALYESSAAFGMRKALMTESKRSEMEKCLADIAAEKQILESSVEELQHQLDDIEQKFEQQNMFDEKRHFEEIQFLKQGNAQVKLQLEGIIAPKKAL